MTSDAKKKSKIQKPKSQIRKKHHHINIYLATFIGGLDRFVLDELEIKLDDAKVLSHGKDYVAFSYSGGVKSLLRLRSVEEVYFCLGHLKGVDRSRSQLHRIEASARKADLNGAIAIARSLGWRWRGRLRLGVWARMSGRHNFRRVDSRAALERGLRSRPDQLFRLGKDNPHARIGVDTREEETYLLWKLTDESFRQHEEKKFHLPASLRPTVAYAMVQESEPQPDDVFLDPMCGAGTILLERANLEDRGSRRYRYILGGDLEWGALRAAAANIGPRHKPRRLLRWNALELPLDDGSIDKIVCNLPFGKQLPTSYPTFYRDFLGEASRVLNPKGDLVLLVADIELIERYARETGWRTLNVTPIALLGQRSFMVHLGKIVK